MRLKAAFTATAIAEYFRDQGKNVMMMMDSVTRFAMAQREVGLAIGEPPATRGYTPSVFAMLPKLLERTGTSPTGSITALYTVLVDGDDMNEPIADAVRGILDGHIVLSRHLAHAGHYPAVDVLASVSRLVSEITTPDVRAAGNEVRKLMATYKEKADLISIGAYQPGSDPETDAAIAARRPIDGFLKQLVTEPSSADSADQTAGPARAAERHLGSPGRRRLPGRPDRFDGRGQRCGRRHAAAQRHPAAAHPVVADGGCSRLRRERRGVAAAHVRQRARRAPHRARDRADHEHALACGDHALDAALEPRRRAVQARERAAATGHQCTVGELRRLAAERLGERGLVVAEHVDGEPAALGHGGGELARDGHEQERGLVRQGGERRHGLAEGAAADAGGDHGDTGDRGVESGVEGAHGEKRDWSGSVVATR